MKNIILTHEFTPPELEAINQELSELLTSEYPDEKLFFTLSVHRDECINSYISTLEEDGKSLFCNAEIEVNNALLVHAEQLFKASLKQLSGLVRGRKAVKKYT
ncbi:hypothetical protein [Paraglaciecola polaris]|uniref:Uncharacterized protein n=1 Tax=Paraglaciecola polaris LMG 21857 TaxID=1129793 RepID=K6YNW4_9ALTE|nr:hypothetical protein [Paraglaciecola polaris]GAC34399.1 hypothetical protein GPLA_3510 [Paraglaciecola polaris LMG 21857]